MRKKILTVVLSCAAALALSGLFISCGGDGMGGGSGNGGGAQHTQHTYVNYTYNNDATCVSAGTETAKCEYCDETDTRVSATHPATGEHTFLTYTYNDDATCGAAGTETAKCEYCDETDTRVSAAHPATGEHEYVNYVCVNCSTVDPSVPVMEGLSYTEVLDGDAVIGYSVSRGSASRNGVANIPSEYNDKPIVSIAANGFANCYFTSVIIPNTVTRIGSKAFDYCAGLTSIVLPSSVTSIGSEAFLRCGRITSVYYTGDITGWCEISGLYNLMGYSVSVNSTNLYINGTLVTNIVIPDGVTSIASCAFYNCSSTSIEISSSVTIIEDYAFKGCSSLTSVVIPDSVTSIGVGVFELCYGLTIYCEANEQPSGWDGGWSGFGYSTKDIWSAIIWDCNNNDKDENGYAYTVIDGLRYGIKNGEALVVRPPNNIACGDVVISSSIIYNGVAYSVTSIGRYAFEDCSSLTSIEIPNSVTSIGSYAFYGCRSLTSIEIPNGVTSIGDYTFSYCSSLTSIEIPNGVTSIGDSAFWYCSSLTSIVIPSSVTSIGGNAFHGCSSLTIYCEATEQPSGWSYYWNDDTNDTKCPVVWGYKNQE